MSILDGIDAPIPVEPTSAPVRKARHTEGRSVYEAIARRFRHLWGHVDHYLMRIASRSGRLSSFYFALFNRSFDREHRAVLVGRLTWEHSKLASGDTSSLLRRNIHRLEKGLLMRPRRSIFATDYIEETFAFYEATALQEGETCVSIDEMHWAYDVLSEYFVVTSSHPRIDPLRERFMQLPRPSFEMIGGRPWRPYKRDLNSPPRVSFEDLLELAWRRRSVRWFLPNAVPREVIEDAVAVATLSPSACNRQPFHFRVFDDPDLVREVAALPGGTKGFAYNFPAIVVVVGELRNYYSERDRHLIYIDAALASMSFVYAAETLGLSTCCINWPDIESCEQQADRVLQLAPDQRPVMFIAIGYPDPEGMVAYSQKKHPAQLCKYNYESPWKR